MATQRVMRSTSAQARRNVPNRETTTYIDGNVVRHIQAVPRREQERTRRPRPQANTRRNREKALQMNMPYVMFLMAAAVATVFLCVNYLQLQSEGITYRSTIASLEGRLNTIKQANDNAYENAISSVNMEEIKDIAVNELGMEYAGEGQVILYSNQDGDFIRQYAEIPAE